MLEFLRRSGCGHHDPILLVVDINNGPTDLDERSGVISFTVGDAHPHDISTILDSKGIAIRAGHHCAQLVMQHFGISATARASFYLYNSTDDVDRLVEGLASVKEIFGLA